MIHNGYNAECGLLRIVRNCAYFGECKGGEIKMVWTRNQETSIGSSEEAKKLTDWDSDERQAKENSG